MIPTPTTRTILLLCGRFGRQAGAASPLTTREYHRLAIWLKEQGERPESLVEDATLAERYADGAVTSERLKELLGREVAASLAVEQWLGQGLQVIGRGDRDYPADFRRRLLAAAPPLLFVVGDVSLPGRGGLAVVGSRDADADALSFCRTVGNRCAAEKIHVISGAAKGVDRETMSAALEEGGVAIGVLAEGVARQALTRDNRAWIERGQLVLLSSYAPESRWTAANAMERNKLIYSLGKWAMVVRSNTDGGTWNGAGENLRHKWVPLFVRTAPDIPQGNTRLIEKGGIPITAMEIEKAPTLDSLLESRIAAASHNSPVQSESTQLGLF